MRPVTPGSVRPATPRVPPSTPFQPGAPPAPPLSPLTAGLGGLLLLGQFLWGLLNQRGREEFIGPQLGDVLTAYPGGNGPFTILWQERTFESDTVSCDPPGILISPASSQVNQRSIFVFASGIRIGTTEGSGSTICGTGGGSPNQSVPAISTVFAGGGGQDLIFVNVGGVFPSSFFNRRNSFGNSISNIRIDRGGEIITGGQLVRQPLPGPAPQVPLLPVPTVAPPVPIPAPVPRPQRTPAPDEAQPIPAPAAPPSPGSPTRQAPSRPAVPVRPSTPSTPRAPSTPGAAQVTASGTRPQLPPAPQPTNTGTTFLPGGRPLAPNGPTPTMQGIATELGKLEQKLEIVLNPKDELSPLDLLNRIIDQVENIKFVLDALFPPDPYTFGAGAYQLQPVCEKGPDGDPLPPLEATWAGGEGEFTELRQRLDALAELIQLHKNTKQPNCGGPGAGRPSNVTVHFESP